MSKTTSKTPQQLENTLDYYSDDMSRKAVGRLFDGIDVQEIRENEQLDEPDEPSIVKGYDKERLPEPDDEPAPKRGGRDSSSYVDIDYDLSLYRKKKGADDVDDDVYDDIYINKPRRRAKSPTPEPAVIKRTSAPPRPKARAKEPDYDGIEPLPGERLSKEYSHQMQTRRERDELARTAYAQKAAINLRPYVLAVFFLLIVILAIMVVRMNSLNSRLIEAEKIQATLNQDLERYTSIQLTNEDLKKQVSDLEKKLADAEATPSTAPTPSPEDATSPTTNTSAVTLPAVYTVQSGDNLSKISKKFYGSPNQFQKIMTANALSSETISVGMVLTIPE